MLINLSNHPSRYWTREQIEASRVYGDLVDYPFPHIDPKWGVLELEQQVEKTMIALANWIGTGQVVVHVMGELTFTLKLVTRLQQQGVLCVASTTQRTVLKEGPQKVSTFQFVRFREY